MSESKVSRLDPDQLRRYLEGLLGKKVKTLNLSPLGAAPDQDVKGFGYGMPVRVEYEIEGGERKSAVLHTMAANHFGHEDPADRARTLLWSHRAFNRLPRHVRSFDIGGFHPGGDLVSAGDVEEFFLLTEYADGEPYALDLERLRDTGDITSSADIARCEALCDYLIEIHSVKGTDGALYVRRIRELVGDAECIMGLTDSYPPHPLFTPQVLEEIEHRAIRWRWRLKDRTHRLRQVHGDFHPWNILFGLGTHFHVLDRSRGEYGDPADDVTSLTLNYVFFSLQRSGRLEGGFETLFRKFWDRYLLGSGDREILQVAAPFLAFRGLVMASPVWYPHLSDEVRRKLLTFICAVLETEMFDPAKVNQYCGA